MRFSIKKILFCFAAVMSLATGVSSGQVISLGGIGVKNDTTLYSIGEFIDGRKDKRVIGVIQRGLAIAEILQHLSRTESMKSNCFSKNLDY